VRDYAEFARNAVRVWMRAVLEEKDWSANEWAKLAKTSPTNITRMLSPISKTMPSVDTVCKLATVAGSAPNLVFGKPQEAAPAAAAPCNFCPDCGYDLRQITAQRPLNDQSRRRASTGS